MWLTTWRDLQWRLRRFVIAGTGAALVFAMSLVLAGLADSFRREAERAIDAVGADSWVLPEGVAGVFTTLSVLPESTVAQVAALPGVESAHPLMVIHHTARRDKVVDVNVIGYADGGLGEPRLASGRLPRAPGEVVTDASLGADVGERVQVAGRELLVVGRTERLSALAGQPFVFLRLRDAQAQLAAGGRIVNAVATKGVPRDLPPGLQARSRDQSVADLTRPLDSAITSIHMTTWLLWLVAALVVGSVVYLSALERARDFAVYKATGWSTRSLAGGLALQAVLLSVGAAVIGVLLANAMAPLFPLPVTIPGRAMLLLPGIGVACGLLACVSGLRKAVGVEPALAFGGAA